jgi:hypothetical protein
MGPSQNLWVGLKFNSESFGGWTDGKPVTYTNWASNEPNSDASLSCTEMLYHSVGINSPGHWQRANCATKRPFLCEKTLDPQYEDNINQAPNPSNCPKDYYPWDTSCYKISTRAGWGGSDKNGAADKCKSDPHSSAGYAGLGNK